MGSCGTTAVILLLLNCGPLLGLEYGGKDSSPSKFLSLPTSNSKVASYSCTFKKSSLISFMCLGVGKLPPEIEA